MRREKIMASRKTTTVLPKYKQLSKRIKELREDRRELEHTIKNKEDSLKLWRERLWKAEDEYARADRAYWKIVLAMRKRKGKEKV